MSKRSYFIHTATGGQFHYGESYADIRLEDVAKHLSKVSRFSGATKFHYSVGHHAILVANILNSAGYDYATCLHGLHHDDHEAFIGDFPTPFQHWMRDAICGGVDYLSLAKDILDHQIMPKMLGEKWPASPERFEAVEWADKTAFVTEAMQLFPVVPEWLSQWIDQGYKPVDINISEQLPSEIEERFLSLHRVIWNLRESHVESAA